MSKLSEMIPTGAREKALADFWYAKGRKEANLEQAASKDKRKVTLAVTDGRQRKIKLSAAQLELLKRVESGEHIGYSTMREAWYYSVGNGYLRFDTVSLA